MNKTNTTNGDYVNFVYRGYPARTKKVFNSPELRLDGELFINGQWKVVSPDALNHEVILKEFNEEINKFEEGRYYSQK